MSYKRVIPRDLFNEANLKKCYGRLAILLGETRNHNASIGPEAVDDFIVTQNYATGGITISNLDFTVRGVKYNLERPLNSRQEWPLYVTGTTEEDDFEEIEVFDDCGNFSDDMIKFICH